MTSTTLTRSLQPTSPTSPTAFLTIGSIKISWFSTNVNWEIWTWQYIWRLWFWNTGPKWWNFVFPGIVRCTADWSLLVREGERGHHSARGGSARPALVWRSHTAGVLRWSIDRLYTGQRVACIHKYPALQLVTLTKLTRDFLLDSHKVRKSWNIRFLIETCKLMMAFCKTLF